MSEARGFAALLVNMTAKTLMLQGTASAVGKSLIVTALCRIFARRGLRVAPFQAQNMPLNTLPEIMQSFTLLAKSHDLIVLEGTGNPAEINMRENDITNMSMAEMANAPVVLVGDIDRGGVFASLFGTVKLLEPTDQRRIRGFIINKFRGDPATLEPRLRDLEYILARPVLGVLPWLEVYNFKQSQYDLLADQVEACLDMDNLNQIIGS